MPSPFHEGERLVQERAGVGDRIEKVGRIVFRSFMLDEHRELFAKLPYLLVGSLDGLGRPWASVLTGPPGFISSPDPRTLRVDASPAGGDPLAGNLAAGAPVGLLGIELSTRRRNRMNGTIVETSDRGFTVEVGQSFGNCPKYIQARQPLADAGSARESARLLREENATLSKEAAALIGSADTFFIATAAPGVRGGDRVAGVDVSHRGGKAGFVRASEEESGTVLTWPDFRGNFFFNTLGNLALNPRAGMLIIDFNSGAALSLTGEAEIIWQGAEVAAFAGAERLLRFRVTAGFLIGGAVLPRWSAAQPAPQLATTGSWENVGWIYRHGRAQTRPSSLEPPGCPGSKRMPAPATSLPRAGPHGTRRGSVLWSCRTMNNVLLYLTTVAIWGSSWLAITWQLGVVAPEASIVYRFALSAALLIAWCAVRQLPLRFSAQQHLFMAIQGVLLFSVNYILFYFATFHLTSGLVAVTFSTIVVMNIGFGSLLLGSTVRPRVAIGAILGIAGLALVFWPDLRAFDMGSTGLFGLVLSLLATASASLGNIASAHNQRSGIPVVQGNAFSMAYGAAFTIAVALARGVPFSFDSNPPYVLSLIYLALFASVFAFGCYLTLLGRIGADRAAYASVLFPVVALGLSTLFEDFRWSAPAFAGVALIVLGNVVVLARLGSRRAVGAKVREGNLAS